MLLLPLPEVCKRKSEISSLVDLPERTSLRFSSLFNGPCQLTVKRWFDLRKMKQGLSLGLLAVLSPRREKRDGFPMFLRRPSSLARLDQPTDHAFLVNVNYKG